MFKEKIKKIKSITDVINTDDLKVITNDKNAYIKAGYTKWLNRLRRWLYSLDKNIDSLRIANELVTPSYVSLETVLSFYSIIPDAVVTYNSITTKPRKTYKNDFWTFYYSNLKKDLYFWYKFENWIFSAEKEKALLDYFYLKSKDLKLTIYDYNHIDKKKFSSMWCRKAYSWFKGERFENLDILSFRKLKNYSKKFNKKVYYMTKLLIYYYKENEQKFRKIL